MPKTHEQENQKPNPEDAILVNTMLRKRLVLYRKNIQEIIGKIDERLGTLENFLEDAKSNDVKDAMSFKTTYIKCGMPYFKDALSYPAPENEDFKYRKNVLNEMFPFDLPQRNISWRTKEKLQLVNGIKTQMINHIKIQQSKKVCQEVKTRKKMQKLRFISNNSDLSEMSISNLFNTIQTDHQDFQINWNLISFNDLQSTHSVTECMGMWYSYLKPDINREPFTDEENALLSHYANECKYQNWDFIAQQLERRTSLQTFSYFSSASSRLCPPNVRWTAQEDELLLDTIKKHTNGNLILWNKVGTSIPSRSKTQCYNRFIILNKNANTKKGIFSANENRILLNYVAKYGTDFSKMPEDLLPNRSLTQIKSHYNVALKHKGKVNPWTLEEDIKLMDFVKKEGTNNWKMISDILQTHNRLSCRTRYLTISKFLQKNPTKSIEDVPSRLKTVTAVHKAVHSDSDEEEPEDVKKCHTKAFGLLSFEEFRMKNINLYNLMKTSYNYKLTPQELNFDYHNFLFLKSFLDVEHYGLQRKFAQAFTPNQYTKINDALSSGLDDSLEAEIIKVKRNSNMLVPLSYHTAVGLRSIAIKIHEDAVDTKERPVLNPPTEAYDTALQKFQKLFMSLFYWPAMLSKLESSELTDFKSIRNQRISQINFFKVAPSYVAVTETQPSVKRSSTQQFYISAKKKQKLSKTAKLEKE